MLMLKMGTTVNPLQTQKSANKQAFLPNSKIAANFVHTFFFGNAIH